MIITFCGHSDFKKHEKYRDKMLDLLHELVGDMPVEFYLGNYGDFDNFAFLCCLEFKKSHPDSRLVFVTPYIDQLYLDRHLPLNGEYDEILYPDLENKPLRFAISYRNKYMVEKSDVVIAYIERSFGGAYKTYTLAQKKGKTVYNLFQNE